MASERARYRCYAEQRLACANADGAARLVLSFKNHIRRCGGTVARTATDLRLPQVPVWNGELVNAGGLVGGEGG